MSSDHLYSVDTILRESLDNHDVIHVHTNVAYFRWHLIWKMTKPNYCNIRGINSNINVMRQHLLNSIHSSTHWRTYLSNIEYNSSAINKIEIIEQDYAFTHETIYFLDCGLKLRRSELPYFYVLCICLQIIHRTIQIIIQKMFYNA